MVSVTQAFGMDLTGQVCVDQSGGEFYGGVSTQAAFLRGAARSSAKPIIFVPPPPTPGRCGSNPLGGRGRRRDRAPDVHYVVTEYGIAYLLGSRSGSGRCR